jgi:hypothetical protein
MRELGANLQQAAITTTTPKNPNEKIARGHPRSRTCGSPRSSETLGVTGFHDSAHPTRQPHNHPLQAGSLHRLMFRARAPSCHSRLGKDLPRRVTTPKLLLSLAELFDFFLYSLDGFFFALLRGPASRARAGLGATFVGNSGSQGEKRFVAEMSKVKALEEKNVGLDQDVKRVRHDLEEMYFRAHALKTVLDESSSLVHAWSRHCRMLPV